MRRRNLSTLETCLLKHLADFPPQSQSVYRRILNRVQQPKVPSALWIHGKTVAGVGEVGRWAVGLMSDVNAVPVCPPGSVLLFRCEWVKFHHSCLYG